MTSEPRSQDGIAWIGRYALFDELARGGMASVHVGRLRGSVGFAKTVAIKKMLGGFAGNQQLLNMFLDEARLAGRIQHPNVVSVVDVIADSEAAYLIMEYVDGLSLGDLWSTLFERGERVAPAIAVHIIRDALSGLQAAHEATNERGESLQLVHRDVSPQNILVGADGVSRVLDFGIAKTVGRQQDTDSGQIKGKVSYMAPEQLLGQPVDRRVDIFSAGVVLWEALAGQRLFPAKNAAEAMYQVLEKDVPALGEVAPEVPAALADVVIRAIAREPGKRFATALEFAVALENSVELIPNHVVGRWVLEVGGDVLLPRRERIRAIEAIPIPAEPEPLPRAASVSVSASAAFVRGLPDDVTRADVPITVASEVQPLPRRSLRLGIAGAVVAVSALAWLLWPRGPSASSPTAEPSAVPSATSSAPAAAASAEPTAPTPSALPSASTTAPNRPRKTTPPRKAAPKPESLFSRE